MEKIKLSIPIIVEGKYDKIKLDSIIDGTIITTDGFKIFKQHEKSALIKSLADKYGIIILTDSDGGGKTIRSFLTGCISNDKIYQLYIPQIKGKEKRKTVPSKEGYLGVEGIPANDLYEIISNFVKKNDLSSNNQTQKQKITTTDLYNLNLTGHTNSKEIRCKIAKEIGLPQDMTSKSFLAAVNLLYSLDELIKIVKNHA